jgi:hypothetical protein
MLKYLFAFYLLFFSFACASDADGPIDPEFYKTYTIEVDGHIYKCILFEHSETCPCKNES